MENRILYYLHEIEKLDTLNSDDTIYPLDSCNKLLLNYLDIALKKCPLALAYNFPKLKNTKLHIVTSDDRKFRIYYWDVGGGGYAHSCNALAQYVGVSGTKVLNDISKMSEGDVFSGLNYYSIATIKTQDNRKRYVTIAGQSVSMGLYYEEIKAFAIVNGKLDDSVKLFRARNRSFNNIGYTWEATKVGNNNPNINLSRDKRKILIPIIEESGRVTNGHLVYVFDGRNYILEKRSKK